MKNFLLVLTATVGLLCLADWTRGVVFTTTAESQRPERVARDIDEALFLQITDEEIAEQDPSGWTAYSTGNLYLPQWQVWKDGVRRQVFVLTYGYSYPHPPEDYAR